MYDVKQVLTILSKFYGPRPWFERNEPLKELIQTILAQHTSDLNAERAYDAMWAHFGGWEAIAGANIEELTESIRSGGLARQKAPRIQGVLKEIYSRRGSYDLDFLRDLPPVEVLPWLTTLNGVGPKTARCVLVFSLGFPAIPVDTHVHRVAKRLGLIPPKMAAEPAHAVLETAVPAAEQYLFHVYLIEHGRGICKALRPLCRDCPLSPECPAYPSGIPGSRALTKAKPKRRRAVTAEPSRA